MGSSHLGDRHTGGTEKTPDLVVEEPPARRRQGQKAKASQYGGDGDEHPLVARHAEMDRRFSSSGGEERSDKDEVTQGYVYDSAEQCEARFKGEDPGYIYSRYSNPTIGMFERRMIELEGAEAGRSTATGMAAVTTAVLAPLKAGDHVVAAKQMFGSCRYVIEDLLPRYGVQSTLVDGLDLEQWRKAMRPNTRSCFLESPTNPTLDVLDISAIAGIAHQGGARLIVDNVFATPIWQSPLTLGADVVVYSATKHIDGQGRCLGGMILGSAGR